MYKLILTHEVMPGKLPALNAWFRQRDAERKQQNPEYQPPKRYITVYGSLHQVVIEAETESAVSHLTERAYAELGGEGAQGEFLAMIVPGRSELRLLKELDLG
jgi:hypothetical protein